MKPFISVDFDGVLNNYKGYDGDNLGTIRPGAREFLQKLSEDYTVLIHTARRYTLVVQWITDNNLWEYVGDVSVSNNLALHILMTEEYNSMGTMMKY